MFGFFFSFLFFSKPEMRAQNSHRKRIDVAIILLNICKIRSTLIKKQIGRRNESQERKHRLILIINKKRKKRKKYKEERKEFK